MTYNLVYNLEGLEIRVQFRGFRPLGCVRCFMFFSPQFLGQSHRGSVTYTWRLRDRSSEEAINNNNNNKAVTLAEHTSDHGKQANASTKKGGTGLVMLLLI